MTDVLIVSIIFTFAGIVAVTAIFLDHKKDMLELELRREEMRMGYPPGTYTKGKKGRKAKGKNIDSENLIIKENIVLEKSIDDLLSRIDNIETIHRSKNEN